MRRALGVPPGPLGLAVPELEAPLPPLVMAVWPPLPPGPPPPALELVDLDEAAADGSVRALPALFGCSADGGGCMQGACQGYHMLQRALLAYRRSTRH